MSVRRLDPHQPAVFTFTDENLAWANGQIAKFPPGRQWSAVIPLLWRAQEQAGGWLPEPAIRAVGELLDMPYIRVYEIATFYTMFNLSPVGTYFIQLCGTTPCMLRGAEEIKAVCRKMIGPERKVSADGLFSWLEVECLGACVNAPMVQINKDYFEDLTPDSFTTLLTKLKAGVAVKPGPQSNRQFSAPASGPRTLLESDA
jgi:NADH-quinone oxidoreductase subunit E